jgi:hypothetical protein
MSWSRCCAEILCMLQVYMHVLCLCAQFGSQCVDGQVPSNWTIDVSTRTIIGGLRMEDRKV